jgi:hypothetical protein
MRKVNDSIRPLVLVLAFIASVVLTGCHGTHKTTIETPSDAKFSDQGLKPKLDYSDSSDTETIIKVYDPKVEMVRADARNKAEQEKTALAQSIIGNKWCLMFCKADVDTKPPCDENCCARKAQQQNVARRTRVASAPKQNAPANVNINTVVVNPEKPAPTPQPSQQVVEQPAVPLPVPAAAPALPAPMQGVQVLEGMPTCYQQNNQYCPVVGEPPVNVDLSVITGSSYEGYNRGHQYRPEYHPREREPREPRQPQPTPKPSPTPRPKPTPVGCNGCNPGTGIGSGNGGGTTPCTTGQCGRPVPVTPTGPPVTNPFQPRTGAAAAQAMGTAARQSIGSARMGGGGHSGGGGHR